MIAGGIDNDVAVPFDGVILDVDGTLVDSNEAHARAWVDALTEFGIVVPLARVRPLIGTGTDKLLSDAAGLGEHSPRGRAIAARRGEIFRTEYPPAVRPLPGIPDPLHELRDDGFNLAVASSAEEDDLRRLLAVARAEWLLDDANARRRRRGRAPLRRLGRRTSCQHPRHL